MGSNRVKNARNTPKFAQKTSILTIKKGVGAARRRPFLLEPPVFQAAGAVSIARTKAEKLAVRSTAIGLPWVSHSFFTASIAL